MTSIDSQKDLFDQVNVSCFRIEGDSVENDTDRFFKVGDISVLSDLKELCRRFGLEWNFVSTRSGKTIACNRANRRTSSVLLSENRHILYAVVVGLFVRCEEWKKCTNSDPVDITAICGVHSNTCDPSYVD